MPDITEASLPGVGVRHEFVSSSGQRIVVVSSRSGRRDISVYRRDDPDACMNVLELDAEDANALGAILGAPQMASTVAAMQQLEGLALDWLTIRAGSPAVGTTIADGQYRTRTGSSVVAVVRGGETVPAPGPGFRFEAGDVAVAVGTTDGLRQLRELLRT